MSSVELPPDNAESGEEELVEAGRYGSEAEATEHGLVVLALGQPYWLAGGSDGVRLLIRTQAAPVAHRHLAAYAQERTRWPPPSLTDPWTPQKSVLITPLLWAVTVLTLFQASGKFPEWVEQGLLDSRAIFNHGEVWRLVTALFLHADAAHVISNALGGLLVFPAVLSSSGVGRGWLLLLLASAVGNLAVAAANYSTPYSSLGASTAIFAGVGLLSGRAIRVAWRSTHPHRWRAMFAPFAAGLTVLALYGAGGQRVDVGAHLTGFVAGLIFGFAAGVRGTFHRAPEGNLTNEANLRRPSGPP